MAVRSAVAVPSVSTTSGAAAGIAVQILPSELIAYDSSQCQRRMLSVVCASVSSILPPGRVGSALHRSVRDCARMHSGRTRQIRALPGGAAFMLVTIDVGSRVPFHEQLAAILREKIRTGEIDSRVPSIVTLAQEHGVARRTAAHALGTLADEGLIVAVRGKGFCVAERG